MTPISACLREHSLLYARVMLNTCRGELSVNTCAIEIILLRAYIVSSCKKLYVDGENLIQTVCSAQAQAALNLNSYFFSTGE